MRAGLGLVRPEVVRVTDFPSTTSWPFGRCGSSSLVALCGGVAKSSSPLITSVSTFESRTWPYMFSSGFAGQASSSRPPAQIRSVPGLPKSDPVFAVAKYGRAAAASVLADGGDIPPDCTLGKAICAISDWNHSAAAVALLRRRARVDRPRRRRAAAPSVVAAISPKNAAALTLPSLIGRNNQRSGMLPEAEWIEAARSVRPARCRTRPARRARSSGGSARRSSSHPRGSVPGGLTPIITERWMLSG